MRTLSVVAILLLSTAPAAAAELTAVGNGTVREVDFRYDVELAGLVAKVVVRQELRASEGDDPIEAVYAFALPEHAAIVGLAVTPPGGKAHKGAAVDSEAAITLAADRETVAMVPDLGLVRRLGGGEGTDVAYELRVYPITADATTIVEVTWVAPMRFVDGRLVLRVPPRGGALGAVSGTIRATPPPGVKKLRDLHAGGELAAATPGKDAWPFVAEGELTIDVTPVLTAPVVSYATAKIGDDGGALAVTILRPRADDAPSRFARALFLVDTSTSNASDDARAAMAALVDGVIGGLRKGARVQALLFDRTVRPALTDFEEALVGTRDLIREAITSATGHPGTDLVRAMGEAHKVIVASQSDADTLVVIVTDGVLPTDADLAALTDALEPDGTVAVSALLIAPDDLPAPDPRVGPLSELASLTGGHVVATRYGEAAARAATVANEVSAAPDWDLVDIEVRGDVSLALPDVVGAGDGGIVFGWYRGDAPDELRIPLNEVDGLTAKKSKAGVVPRLGALALAAGAPMPSDTRNPVASMERKLGVVGAFTALVSVDRTDELAAARLDLAARGGTFSRIPPPPELEVAMPELEIEGVVDVGARYEMDTAGRIRADLINPQLLPAAHACFDAARVRGKAPSGKVTLEIELARGEVIAARTRSTGATELLTCLRDAAYALTVPTYTLDADADTIHVIRYPIEFATKGSVAVGDDEGLEPIDLGDAVDQPLGDLPERD